MTQNRIIEVKLTAAPDRPDYFVTVTKQFASEYGGGQQTFAEYGGESLHQALDVARAMVTMSPARRTEVL